MGYELKHKTEKRLSEGKFYPIGAEPKNGGVNFSIYSKNAKAIFLLLFDNNDNKPSDIIEIKNQNRHIWHIFVHGIKEGQLYGFKVKGDYNPAFGLRFNENKLLIDPYAKALTGKFNNLSNLLVGYDADSSMRDLSFNNQDNSHLVPKSIVINNAFEWDKNDHPDIPLEKLVIYEAHLKGFTAHKSSKVKNPGTYLGFIEKIPYLKELGINAVEFLPIQEFYIDDFLVNKGLTNYWGYNTIGFFAPESSYSSRSKPGCQVKEFKEMVKALHRAGIEIILDVVYNHTGEGSEVGPTLCFKGIDNPTYYCLSGSPSEPYRYYLNYTGCGNSINISNSTAIRLVMDSLRYWVEEMHVDGFRFDLASVLGRDGGGFNTSASFFDAISQDPVLNRIKLIAEPWDLGTYQVGNFPVDWSEWNGKFRDTCRRFGKGNGGQIKEIATRLTGSADLYSDDGRSAFNSINFITCHDGFTLNDLVSYDHKHNEANLEGNNDGANDNDSWNCGVEGVTNDYNIICLRKRLIKNYFCYLLFSGGTPMILGGDEFMRSQKGNNNAYCQDNDISWVNWEDSKNNSDILNFVKKAIVFTKKYTILQRRKFFTGLDMDNDNVPDIVWFGKNLSSPEWDNFENRILCYQLDGSEEKSEYGEYLIFVILNSDYKEQIIKIPSIEGGKKWYRVIDTALESGADFLDEGKELLIDPQIEYFASPRSTVVLIGK